jgi:hypothetical protein
MGKLRSLEIFKNASPPFWLPVNPIALISLSFARYVAVQIQLFF